MADTAKRLFGPSALGTSAADVYTTPGSTTTIVRNVHVVNTTAADKVFTMSVGNDAAGTRFFQDTVPANGHLDWNGFLVLAAAEKIQAYGDAAGLTGTASGVEVT